MAPKSIRRPITPSGHDVLAPEPAERQREQDQRVAGRYRRALDHPAPGDLRRHGPSAVTASRMLLTIIRPTAPPTAPSGESVDTENRNARAATTSSVIST